MRTRQPPPRDRVRRRLEGRLPAAALDALPRDYFRVGDVLVLDLPLPDPTDVVAQAYAQELRMRAVLGRDGHVEGELRRPTVRRLWGDADTRTTHVENGIRYRLDPTRVMWSQGNIEERRRVASWDLTGKTVVDLFAGVGYFTLPAAVHARATRVFACEKNPESHAFLLENMRLNGVDDRVEARLGDCRAVAPHSVADHVLLGLLPDAAAFVPVALRALRPEGGIVHVHRVVPADASPQEAFAPVHAHVRDGGRGASLLRVQRVKSYGPGRDHVVLDVEVRP